MVITMDIAGLSMNLSAASNMSDVSIAVLDKAMDTNKELGQGLINMIDSAAMELSVNPEIGANFDMRI